MRNFVREMEDGRKAAIERRNRGISVGNYGIRQLTPAEQAERDAQSGTDDAVTWHFRRHKEIEAWRRSAIAEAEARYEHALRKIRGETFEEIPF